MPDQGWALVRLGALGEQFTMASETDSKSDINRLQSAWEEGEGREGRVTTSQGAKEWRAEGPGERNRMDLQGGWGNRKEAFGHMAQEGHGRSEEGASEPTVHGRRGRRQLQVHCPFLPRNCFLVSVTHASVDTSLALPKQLGSQGEEAEG